MYRGCVPFSDPLPPPLSDPVPLLVSRKWRSLIRFFGCFVISSRSDPDPEPLPEGRESSAIELDDPWVVISIRGGGGGIH